MLKGPQTLAQVHKLRTATGTVTQFPDKIATEFRNFYLSLYNLTRPDQPVEIANKRYRNIREYLTKFVTNKLPPDEMESMEEPITEAEVAGAIKTAKTGCTPGPNGYTLDYYKKFKTHSSL
ncbi:Hypothetical predicted protein [Pelobates cultripes]|uniref:Uncharacterized protein n=1 Tax=Pelobates cultripes TaxID=61616 RepID=A0AAD1VY74_PELCU|nr:Hypothetical predicted protein [Pelobates cultripes]